MASTNMNNSKVVAGGGKDSIVIVKNLGDIPGGRSLDVTGFTGDYILAGHIIKLKANGDYAPLGISSGAYATLASGESYAGVLAVSVPVSDPRAAIMTIGQVNAAASPYPVTATIKSGLPRIEFLY